ncbi:hypothetical protein SAMD00023353_4700370 [Rosellinia necatrix]|uniref:Uncharacterized protein n=1 Tax=Rosellinia necatrix TaxID=77044 RepID=A0A1S8AAL9_ROSNE|nr:hypothetical protein SAMD00023353_4700370 [Rosellinia necatrix]
MFLSSDSATTNGTSKGKLNFKTLTILTQKRKLNRQIYDEKEREIARTHPGDSKRKTWVKI